MTRRERKETLPRSLAPKADADDVVSCSASRSTAPVKNGGGDARTAVSSNTPDADEDAEYVEKASVGSASVLAASTPEPKHVRALGPEPEASPRAAPSPAIRSDASPESVAAEEERVRALRAEASRILAEQARLREEIRRAELKKESLEKTFEEASAAIRSREEGGDDVEIFCDNPLEVMSAITEEHRTLVLEGGAEVMSQITEARTEARHFDNLRRRRRWMVGMACVLGSMVVAAVAVGVASRNRGGARGGGDSSGGAAGASSGSTDVQGAGGPSVIYLDDELARGAPSTFPTRVDPGTNGPNEIDSGDDSVSTTSTPSAVTARPTILTDDEIVNTKSPSTSSGEVQFPTPSPSDDVTTASPISTAVYASKVKIQSNNEAILNVFEVQVLDPSGVNVAVGKETTQSSTWEDNLASYAVDESMDTFSSTLSEEGAWWQVDLGGSTPVDTVTIWNLWCIDQSDPVQCLDRLSNSTVYLLDENDAVVATRYIESTAGVHEVMFQFDATNQTVSIAPVSVSLPPFDSPTEAPMTMSPSDSPIEAPKTISPSASSIQTPTSMPSFSPVQSCSSDEAILSIFFVFGADPSGVSWHVVESCTGNRVAECNQCYLYQNTEPYAAVDHHICLPMAGYTFYFEDSVGDVWPASSGYAVVFDGDSQNVPGDGGSLPSSSMSLGGESPCPRNIPTSVPTQGSTQVSTTFHDLPFSYPYPYPRFTQWDVLSYSYRANAERLGYNRDYWDNPRSLELEDYPFSLLNSTQQLYILAMGLSEEQWDCYVNHYESFGWDSLPDFARQTLVYLGWTQCSWEFDPNCPAPASESYNWRKLNSTEKEAAYRLCWFKSSWDSYPLPW